MTSVSVGPEFRAGHALSLLRAGERRCSDAQTNGPGPTDATIAWLERRGLDLGLMPPGSSLRGSLFDGASGSRLACEEGSVWEGGAEGSELRRAAYIADRKVLPAEPRQGGGGGGVAELPLPLPLMVAAVTGGVGGCGWEAGEGAGWTRL